MGVDGLTSCEGHLQCKHCVRIGAMDKLQNLSFYVSSQSVVTAGTVSQENWTLEAMTLGYELSEMLVIYSVYIVFNLHCAANCSSQPNESTVVESVQTVT